MRAQLGAIDDPGTIGEPAAIALDRTGDRQQRLRHRRLRAGLQKIGDRIDKSRVTGDLEIGDRAEHAVCQQRKSRVGRADISTGCAQVGGACFTLCRAGVRPVVQSVATFDLGLWSRR